jgi:hypothetical protein
MNTNAIRSALRRQEIADRKAVAAELNDAAFQRLLDAAVRGDEAAEAAYMAEVRRRNGF